METNRRKFLTKVGLVAGAAALPGVSLLKPVLEGAEGEVVSFISRYGSDVRVSSRSAKEVHLIARISDVRAMGHTLSDPDAGTIVAQGSTVTFVRQGVSYSVRHVIS